MSTATTPGIARAAVRVDRPDRRVGERAADDLHVERAGDREVVDEARLAGQEHGVFTPEPAGADDGHR